MKIRLILIFIFCIGLGLQAQQLKVASYNIRYKNDNDAANGNGWDQRCPVITQLIRFHDFDIFGAQEVLNKQLYDILDSLPGYNYIGVGRDDGKEEGEYAPIFYKSSKFQLLQSGHFWLSEFEDRPNKGWDAALPRICTWGKFKLKNSNAEFWFFNLHMDHIGVKARIESAKLIVQKIKLMCTDDPVILTGDFNVDQQSDSYKIFIGSGILQDSYDVTTIRYAQNGTFNNFDPDLKTESRIDHIFTTKGILINRYGILTDSYRSEINSGTKDIKSDNFPKEVTLHQYKNSLPSDHFPVMVELEIK